MKSSVRLPFLPVNSAMLSGSFVNQVSKISNGALLFTLTVCLGAAISSLAAAAQTVTYSGSGAVNFGTINVCGSGKTTPAPCNKSATLTYNITASGALGTPRVLTSGAPNLDYTLIGGSTCSGSVNQGNTCTVNVNFAPTQPGARNGAVEIVAATGKVLSTTYIFGTGVGPRMGFSPASAVRTISADIGGISLAAQGISAFAVDGNGNIFVGTTGTETSASVIELLAVDGAVPANPVAKVLANLPDSTLHIGAVAIDGAGNVFYATSSEFTPGSVYELLAADGYTTSIPINIKINFSLSLPVGLSGLAVDGSANLFVSLSGYNPTGYQSSQGQLVEVLAAGGYATTKTLAAAAQLPAIEGYPSEVAVDANGNLFAGFYDGILELSPSDGYNTARTINSYGSNYGLALDPAGNLFLSSGEEFLAVGGVLPANPASTRFPELIWPNRFVFDAHGNLYLSDEYGLQELPLSTPPALSFEQTIIGQTSTDSPQSVLIQNEGNATLDLTGLSLDSSNWDLIPGSGTTAECTASSSLASSALCKISTSFKPTEAGPLTGSVTLTNNTPDSQQSIRLNGLGDTVPPPQITNVTNYGVPGAQVVIAGINFGATQRSSSVTFNGITAASCSWSNASICVTVPTLATTGSLIVHVGAENSDPVIFNVFPAPVITGMSPTSGPPGTAVTITGTGLADIKNNLVVTYNGVRINNNPSDTSTSVLVSVPNPTVTGHFQITVNRVTVNSPTFTVSATTHAPHITALSASSAALYANITITGTGFGPSQGSSTVTFNGVVAPVLSWSNLSIAVSVPYRATTGNVVVTAGGLASNAVPFTVVPSPTVTGISPISGPAGTVVTISGTNLVDALGQGVVWLNNIQAPIVSQSNTNLQIKIPTGAVTGVFDVHVNGVGLATPVFTVEGAAADPQISRLSANYGALYAVISITGTGFGAVQGSSTITFNGIPATGYVWTNTGITTTVPYRATSGNVVVTVAGKASNGIPFSIEPTPTVTGISPASGPVGTFVFISGTNLVDAQGHGSIWFGNVNAPILTQSSTSIQVEVPAGATTGTIDVHINGVGNYTPVFTVTNN